ncbi:hypothetical protein NB713_003642 [Xanthomonas sacchari]|nr:hypothetical protein [Xanthomonas sacchari]
MVGAALAADEAVRIGIDRQALAAAGRGAVGIADPRIGVATGGLAGQRQVDRLLGLQRPRMPTVVIRLLARHQRRLGQASRHIVLGVAGDGAGLGHGGLQAGLVQVGGTGAALALAEVDGDADTAVAGGFHGLHSAQAHVDVQPAVFAAADLGLAGAKRAGARQQPFGDVGQALQALLAVVAVQIGGDRVQCFILVVRIPSPLSGRPGRMC